MHVDLTAVYEPQPNGSIIAYLAELPAVTIGARTLEEARVRLAEQARLHLEHERTDTLARIAPGARIEPLRVEIPCHRDTRAELDAGLETRVEIDVRHRTPRVDHDAGEDLVQYLIRQGLLSTAPTAEEADDHFAPIRIQGRPISEEIIEARR